MGYLPTEFESRMKSILYSMEFANGFRRYFFFTLTLLYFISLGHSAVKTTAMFAISQILLMVFELPTGAFADYFSRKKSIIISFLLLGVSFLGFYSFSNFWLLAASYMLSDIGWSFQSGISLAWITDTLRYGKNRKKMSNMLARFYFFEKSGYIIGGVVGFIVIAISFRLVWLIVALGNFLMIFVLLKYMEERNFKSVRKKSFMHAAYHQLRESLRYILTKKNKEIRGIIAAIFFAALGLDIFFVVLPLILTQVHGLPPASISLLMGLLGLIALGAPFLGERATRKHKFLFPLTAGFLILTVTITTASLSTVFLITILAIIVHFTTDTMVSVVNDSAIQYHINSRNRALLGSLINLVWATANSLGAGLVSLGLGTLGVQHTALIGALFTVLAAVGYYVALR